MAGIVFWLAEVVLVTSGATVIHRIIAAVENCPVWQVGSIFATPIKLLRFTQIQFFRHLELPGRQQ